MTEDLIFKGLIIIICPYDGELSGVTIEEWNERVAKEEFIEGRPIPKSLQKQLLKLYNKWLGAKNVKK